MFKISLTLAILLGATLWTIVININETDQSPKKSVEVQHVIQ